MFSIADNLKNVSQSIKKASEQAGRDHAEVQLLPVTKTQSAEVLAQAFAAGLRCFGENYLSEALEKQQSLLHILGSQDYQRITWHFIGPVQSNKTKAIAEHFSWLHSLDRIKIARRLDAQRPKGLPPLNVCIQVNIDAEETKAGVMLDEVEAFAQALADFPHLKLRGLMCIPKALDDGSAALESYQSMKDCFNRLAATYSSVDTLSMGMSGDLESAIQYGSTMVRVGTALFGKRPPK